MAWFVFGVGAGSGFKLNAQHLTSLTLNLGPHPITPLTSLGISFDYGNFSTFNVPEESNIISFPDGGARA